MTKQSEAAFLGSLQPTKFPSVEPKKAPPEEAAPRPVRLERAHPGMPGDPTLAAAAMSLADIAQLVAKAKARGVDPAAHYEAVRLARRGRWSPTGFGYTFAVMKFVKG